MPLKMAQSPQSQHQQKWMDPTRIMVALFDVFAIRRQMGQNDTNSHTENRQFYKESLELNNEKKSSSFVVKAFNNFVTISFG